MYAWILEILTKDDKSQFVQSWFLYFFWVLEFRVWTFNCYLLLSFLTILCVGHEREILLRFFCVLLSRFLLKIRRRRRTRTQKSSKSFPPSSCSFFFELWG
jgi:GT2 family glycosyltransferase